MDSQEQSNQSGDDSVRDNDDGSKTISTTDHSANSKKTKRVRKKLHGVHFGKGRKKTDESRRKDEQTDSLFHVSETLRGPDVKIKGGIDNASVFGGKDDTISLDKSESNTSPSSKSFYSLRPKKNRRKRVVRNRGVFGNGINRGAAQVIHVERDPTTNCSDSVDVCLDFHVACASNPSLSSVRNIFRSMEEDVDHLDGATICSYHEPNTGRLPLHCIGLNRDLILYSANASEMPFVRVESFILNDLLQAHPASIIAEDAKGRIPFTEVIVDWIHKRRLSRFKLQESRKGRKQVKNKLTATYAWPHRSSQNLIFGSNCVGNYDDHCSNFSKEESSHRQKTFGSDFISPPKTRPDEKTDGYNVPPIVEWSLRMLSLIIDKKPASSKPLSRHDCQSKDVLATLNFEANESVWKVSAALTALHRDIIIEKVAAIPYLLSELLLVKDKKARHRLFQLSIVRKVLLCPESLGKGRWLMQMLKNADSEYIDELDEKYIQVEAVVFYLEEISTLTIKEEKNFEIGSDSVFFDNQAQMLKTQNRQSFNRPFDERIDALYDSIGNLHGLLPNLVILEKNLSERAAVTKAVTRLMDRHMSTPFASMIAFFDLMYHILSIMSYSESVASLLKIENVSHAIIKPPLSSVWLSRHSHLLSDPRSYIWWSAATVTSSAYFIVRDIGKLSAKWNLSPETFWSGTRDFWDVVSFTTTLLVFFSNWYVHHYFLDCVRSSIGSDGSFVAPVVPTWLRVFVAVTTWGLWLKFLGCLRMMNESLSTFIISVTNICKDVKWFLVVLLIAFMSSAQMFACLSSDLDPSEVYVQAYFIMLGAFEIPDNTLNLPSKILFILYTFVVTIVLFNVLIAIVSDSYGNSMKSSKKLFCRARIMFVAQLVYIQRAQLLYQTHKYMFEWKVRIVSIALTLFVLRMEFRTIGILAMLQEGAKMSRERLEDAASVSGGCACIGWRDVLAIFPLILLLAAWMLCKRRIISKRKGADVSFSTLDTLVSDEQISAGDGSGCAWRIFDKFILLVSDSMRLLLSDSDSGDEESGDRITQLSTTETINQTSESTEKIKRNDIRSTAAYICDVMRNKVNNTENELNAKFQLAEEQFQRELQEVTELLSNTVNEMEQRIALSVAESEQRILQALAKPEKKHRKKFLS